MDLELKGKKVVIFGLPGAYTPVCSASHLPGYIDNAEKLRKAGFDTIACISVNDPFVMDAWGKSTGADDKVLMLADADGSFTRAIGLVIDHGTPRPPICRQETQTSWNPSRSCTMGVRTSTASRRP